MTETLPTDALLAYLAEPAPAPEASIGDAEPYREAAAVLAAIGEPSRLQPIGAPQPGVDARVILADDLIPATGRKFGGVVMLTPDVRYHAISRLAGRGEIAAALQANPDERSGPIQQQLEHYLLGTAPPLVEQSLAELDATLQVAVWVRDAVPGIPTVSEVHDRAAYLRLLAPFEAIAGDKIFRGRTHELDDLREYIGVLEPASLLRRLRSRAFKWAAPKRKPALSIFGPGGVGKSALVARFMLEHARLPEKGRIPFAYLDFDRLGLDVGDPYGLIIEMLRQLDTQFPEDRFDGIRASAEAQWAKQDPTDDTGRFMAAQSLLADVLGSMSKVLGPRPYVLVLDTFEEVQYRGEPRAFPLWDMLVSLQRRWPFLRVVIAGRAPAQTLRLDGAAARSIHLGDLDDEAAVGYLIAQGIPDVPTARALVKRYGGVPLSLKLVASLFAQEPDAVQAGDLPRRDDRYVAGNQEVIQGMLYDRVLDHIQDVSVRRLAHPGLVLRRITPDVIFSVLDEPCELGLTEPAEAERLFDGLRRESSLVTIDDSDGALVHRSDLRRVMLKLLVASEPARVERIRRAAVSYYDRQTGRRALAEAAYHRLHLGESVPADVLKDPEVRSSIQGSIVEFPAGVQLYLGTLGFQVAEEVLQEASLEQQEQATAALVEEYLPNGPSSELAAKGVLSSTSLDLDHPSPLFVAAARVALQTGDAESAARWIEKGLAQAAAGNATALTLRLLQERAWLEFTTASAADPGTLDSLASFATRYDDRLAIVQHRLLGFVPASPGEDAAIGALAELLAQGPPSDIWALAPATRPVVDRAIERDRGTALASLQGQVTHEAGWFRLAGFADPGTQRKLDAVLRPDLDPRRFGVAFRDLLDGWPYRILFVDVPYARRRGDSDRKQSLIGTRKGGSMAFNGYLTNEQMQALAVAAVGGGLMEVPRQALLSGIPPAFSAALTLIGNPLNQFQSDLISIQQVERMAGGQVPIVTFLENAAFQLRLRGRTEASVFQQILSQIGNRVAGVPADMPADAQLPEVVSNEQIVADDDSVGISFLAMGVEVARSVARISVPRFENGQQVMLPNGGPWVLRGTTWLVGPNLALTNRHVVNARRSDEAAAGEADLRLQALGSTLQFGFDANDAVTTDATVSALLATSAALDYALLAIVGTPSVPIPRIGTKPVTLDPTSRLAVNIIQHPRGEPKQVAFRNNLVTAADAETVRYFTDTDYGSSGSPVCDDLWRVVALHRGTRHTTDISYQGRKEAYVNFGSQIQAVLADIQGQAPDAAAQITAAQSA